MDALHVRYRGGLDPKVRARLVDALAMAKDLGLPSAAVTVGPYELALSARSREGWWHLERADFDATLDEGGHLDGWGLTVKLRAMALASLGPAACVALAGDLATALLQLVEGERVAWVDVCTDLIGFDIGTIVPRQWVGSGRAQAQRLMPSAEECKRDWFLGGERTAFYVGRGDVVARVYDKTVELQNDVVGDKRAAEHARWKASGWSGREQVTRVEFQVRGAALKEIDDGQLRDTSRFVERLDALWKYLTCKWVRLCVLDSATRRSRWESETRWSRVQNASFLQDTGEMAERRRNRGAPRIEYTAAIALSYAAKSGMLDGVALPTLREAERFSPNEARQFVLSKVAAIYGAVGDQVAHTLLAQRGPVRSACFVAERLRAANAKAATVLPAPIPAHRSVDVGAVWPAA